MDIPFAKDDANQFLPWIIALMVLLLGLFASAGLSLRDGLGAHAITQSRTVTVHLPAEQADKAEGLRTELAALEGVEHAELLGQDDIQSMLKPWLAGASADALPLPSLIRLRVSERHVQDIPELAADWQKRWPELRFDRHEQWLTRFLKAVDTLKGAAFVLALLVSACAVAMIVFASKTALRIHGDAVWLLHSFGAQDRYIVRQFQFNAFLLGMKGGLFGTAASGMLFLAASQFLHGLDAPLLPEFRFTGSHALLFILLPPLTGFVAMMAARLTVLRQLRHLP